jgi:inhibitor of cysteine peptidase
MMRSPSRIVALVALAVCVAAVVGCAQAPKEAPVGGPVRVDATADHTTVRLTKGQALIVSLEGNPTTGFDWKVTETPPAQLAVAADSFESSATTGVVGAGGTRVLTYTAAAAGTGVLDLEYVRAWEKGVPAERTFRLTVVVK